MTPYPQSELPDALFDISAMLETVALLAEEMVHNGTDENTDFTQAKIHAIERMARQAQQMLATAMHVAHDGSKAA